jgi:6-pyruvoyltetrahydropterin/6-carboxytetrahydropterin synthase
MLVTKEFSFDAAHNIESYRGKCEALHGHTYRIQITVRAPVGHDGLAFDFAELDKLAKERVTSRLDHSYLNLIVGPQSSAENIAIWAWKQLEELPLYEIKVFETPTSSATYHGPEAESELSSRR